MDFGRQELNHEGPDPEQLRAALRKIKFRPPARRSGQFYRLLTTQKKVDSLENVLHKLERDLRRKRRVRRLHARSRRRHKRLMAYERLAAH